MTNWIIPVKGEETFYEGTYSFQVQDATVKFNNRKGEDKETAEANDKEFLTIGEV